MSVVLYRAGEAWTDLKPLLIEKVNDGKPVMWISASGTVQFFALVHGVLTRTRQGQGSLHAGDGLPLLVEEPFFATSCGCGDRLGYRSTPPLIVASLDDPDHVRLLISDALDCVRQLKDAGHDADRTTAGHPQAPCGAMYCLRITPQLIEAGQ